MLEAKEHHLALEEGAIGTCVGAGIGIAGAGIGFAGRASIAAARVRSRAGARGPWKEETEQESSAHGAKLARHASSASGRREMPLVGVICALPRSPALAARTCFGHGRSVSDRELHATSLALRWAALAGLSAEEVIEEAQLGVDPLGAGGIPHRDGMKLWGAMETLTKDPFIGLTVGTRATLDAMGIIGPMFATAPSLGGGLEVLGQVLPLAIRNAVVSLVVDDEIGAIDYVMPDARVRHGVDAMFVAILVLARQCASEPALRPSYVEHQSARPEDPSRYVACLGCLPRFEAPRCRLAFRRQDLALPFRGSEPRTAALLLESAPKLLSPVETVSLVTTVERALTESLAEGDGSLTKTAEKLATSPRTLQRRLDEHGLEFESMRLELRKKLAIRYLEEGLSVATVAARLAYASRASFTRAFTAWTGHPPTGRPKG